MSSLLVGLALQVGYFVSLVVCALLRPRQFVLRLALALFLAPFALQASVIHEVAGSLLSASGHLVCQSHSSSSFVAPYTNRVPRPRRGQTVSRAPAWGTEERRCGISWQVSLPSQPV